MCHGCTYSNGHGRKKCVQCGDNQRTGAEGGKTTSLHQNYMERCEI